MKEREQRRMNGLIIAGAVASASISLFQDWYREVIMESIVRDCIRLMGVRTSEEWFNSTMS